MQRIPLPFMAVLEIERVSNGKETKEVVLSARPHENSLKQKAAQ